MTSVKISELPAASALDGTEVLPIVQGGVTVKAAVDQLRIVPSSPLSSSSLTISGPTSPVAFGTVGAGLIILPLTQTDGTTAAGTVSDVYASAIGAATFATSANAITIQRGFGLYISAPIAGPNITLTNAWAIGADSIRIARNGTTSPTLAAITGTISAQASTLVAMRVNPTVAYASAQTYQGVVAAPTISGCGTYIGILSNGVVTNFVNASEGIQESTTLAQTVSNVSIGFQGVVASPSIGATNTKNWTGAAPAGLVGLQAIPRVTSGATGTIASIIGVNGAVQNNSADITVTDAWGFYGAAHTATGTVTNAVGMVLAKQIHGTNNAQIVMGTTSVPSGNWGVYDASNYDWSMGGTLACGALKLGNTYVATPPTCSGYVTLKDSTGTTYKVMVAA